MATTTSSQTSLTYFKRTGSPIVAAATAMGGPVCILRISGRDLSALNAFVGSFPNPGSHVLRTFREQSSGRILDRGLVLYFQAPHSFTGEDVLELQVHGVASVIQRLISEIKLFGTADALPGEFSFRAVLNDKMTLAEAEALQTSLSNDGLGQDWASRLLTVDPTNEKHTEELLDKAIVFTEEARARVEAAIDFSEAADEQSEDVESALTRIRAARSKLADLVSSFENFSLASGQIKVAIIGEPNVGKSTLLNRLLGGERALVSPLPGTTRDVVEGRLLLNNNRWIKLLDTAGLRSVDLDSSTTTGHDLIEHRGIELGLLAASQADILIYVKKAGEPKKSSEFDSLSLVSRKPTIMIESFSPLKKPGFYDLRNLSEPVEQFVKQELETVLANRTSRPSSQDQLISQRQYQHLIGALDSLNRAETSLEGARPMELAGEELREAETQIKSALGRGLDEAYIEAIFRQFCLGK